MTKTIKIALRFKNGSIIFKNLEVIEDNPGIIPDYRYGYLIPLLQYNGMFFIPSFDSDGIIQTVGKNPPAPEYYQVDLNIIKD